MSLIPMPPYKDVNLSTTQFHSRMQNSTRRLQFFHGLNTAGLTPLFKTSDSLIVGNYRPVSILVCLSNVMEYVYHKQL